MKILEPILEKIANNKEVFFEIKAFPGAKENSIKKGADNLIKIRVTAQPEDNKANSAIIKFLASKLELRRYQVKIVKGKHDRIKTIKVSR